MKMAWNYCLRDKGILQSSHSVRANLQLLKRLKRKYNLIPNKISNILSAKERETLIPKEWSIVKKIN